MPMFAITLLLLALQPPAQDSLQDAMGSSNRNVNVQNNHGLIIQINPAPPATATELKRHVKAGHSWANVILPGKQPSPPPIKSCPPVRPENTLRVILGTYGDYYCTQTLCPIIMTQNRDPKDFLQQAQNTETLLSVTREGQSMRVHALLFADDGKIEAAIEDDNRLVRNPNNTFEWRHPNAQTLEVVDDRYRKTLHMEFLNENTLYVDGTFYNRVGDFVRINSAGHADDPIDRRGSRYTNVCSRDMAGILF